ncbi:MAG: dihydrolipoamide acetyltransferase, partial [Gammaproteobacteria bacterium]
MSALEPVLIPDLGDIDQVEVIELPIKAGDAVKQDDVLVVLESDKASMEVVAPRDGTLSELYIKEGDSVTSGQKVAALLLLGAELEVPNAPVQADQAANTAVQAADASRDDQSPAQSVEQEPLKPQAAPQQAVSPVARVVESVPDLGDIAAATVIEVNVAVGDRVGEGDPLVVLESDKASMEVPASQAGRVLSILVQEGDSLKSGSPVVEMETVESEGLGSATVPTPASAPVPTPASAPVPTPASAP